MVTLGSGGPLQLTGGGTISGSINGDATALTLTTAGNHPTYTLTASSNINVQNLFIGGTTTVAGTVTVANGLLDVESNSNVTFLTGASITVEGAGAQIDVQGNLTLNSGVTLRAATATLDLISGRYTGPVDFAKVLVGGSVTVTGTDSGAGNVGALVFQGGTLNLTTNLTAGTLSMTNRSDLTGPGVLTVTGNSTVQGGTFTGPGTTIIEGALNILSPNTSLSSAVGLGVDGGRLLELFGQTTWSSGLISLNSQRSATAGTLINEVGAELDVAFDGGAIGTVVVNGGSNNTNNPTALFDNRGLFRKISGTGTTTIETPFSNEGTIEADEGTLNFTGSFTNTGSVVLGPSGVVTGANVSTTIDNLQFQITSGLTPQATPIQITEGSNVSFTLSATDTATVTGATLTAIGPAGTTVLDTSSGGSFSLTGTLPLIVNNGDSNEITLQLRVTDDEDITRFIDISLQLTPAVSG
jgi:hypothetical protein